MSESVSVCLRCRTKYKYLLSLYCVVFCCVFCFCFITLLFKSSQTIITIRTTITTQLHYKLALVGSFDKCCVKCNGLLLSSFVHVVVVFINFFFAFSFLVFFFIFQHKFLLRFVKSGLLFVLLKKKKLKATEILEKRRRFLA